MPMRHRCETTKRPPSHPRFESCRGAILRLHVMESKTKARTRRSRRRRRRRRRRRSRFSYSAPPLVHHRPTAAYAAGVISFRRHDEHTRHVTSTHHAPFRFISRHFASLRIPSLLFASFRFTSPHSAALRFASLIFASSRFISPHFASFRFMPQHFASPRVTLLHFASFRGTSLRFTSIRFAMCVQDTHPRRQHLLRVREGMVSCRPRALQR